MAGNIKQFLQNDKLGIELDSTFASFHVCTSQCKDSTDQVNHNNTIAIWMASSSVVILSTIIFIFVIYKYVNKHPLLSCMCGSTIQAISVVAYCRYMMAVIMHISSSIAITTMAS